MPQLLNRLSDKEMNSEKEYDVIIVGAGIAGLTASLYASRQGMKTLIISRDLGGQLLLTPEIQNFPGFLSISGYELINRVREQVEIYNVPIVYDEVTEIKGEGSKFLVKTLSDQEYESIAVILACGKVPRDLNILGESKFKGRGVSYCVICDAPLFRGKVTAFIGWGHHALTSIPVLKKYAQKVYWVFPGDRPVDDLDLLTSVLTDNIELIPNSTPIEIRGDKKVQSIIIKDKRTNQTRELNVDGIFVEIGYTTRIDFIKGLIDINEKGEIVVNERCETNVPGIFAAGDVTNQPFKQAVISAAQGAIAALSAYNYVSSMKGRKISLKGDWQHLPIKKEKKVT